MKDEKSKSQLKRESKVLQNLGANLTQLSPTELNQIPLPQELREAIVQIKKIKGHSAKKRYLQFVGSMMRAIEEITPIQSAYDKVVAGAQLNTAHFHLIENWRSRLISDGKDALTEFIRQYPCDDTQQLRLSIRKAQSERDHQKNIGASKALFRLIRDLIA